MTLKPIPMVPQGSCPLVSVLVANYNYARFLPDAVESVLAQTYGNWELLICDDGSSDDSARVLLEMENRDPRIRAFYKENGGQASAWNVAYEHSRGEIVCFLDADDRFREDKLEKVVGRFVGEPRTGLVLHRMTVVDSADRPVQEIPFLSRFEKGWIAPKVIARGGRSRDMPSSAISFRREVAERAFPIPEAEFRRFGDGYVCTLLSLLTEVSAIEEPLSLYRLHGSNERGHAGLNTHIVSHDIEATVTQVDAVNRAFAASDADGPVLDLGRNLAYRQNTLLLAMLDGESRRSLAGRYRVYVPMLWRDDLYSRKHQVLASIVYAVAIPLPQFARSRWLATALGYNGMKASSQRLRRTVQKRWKTLTRAGGAA